LIKAARSAISTCNSFPKIFGGNSSDSFLHQIDVYNDYLAMGGGTYDNSLAGITFASWISYVALQSISTGGKIYWAKAFSLKTGSYIGGVQFSTNGALLIVHGISGSSFIVIFNVSRGNVLSARQYSEFGNHNYNHLLKSMLVSSGASPMAYVLSNYKTYTELIGQHLFKFDPLTF